MKYNPEKIGKRIKAERKAIILNGRKMTQDDLIEYLHPHIRLSRNSLSAIENGEIEYCSLKLLLLLCELFNCELGYLLGEYDCKTHEATSVKNQTGLSGKAVDVLCAHRIFGHTPDLELLSGFICYISKYPPMFDEKDRYPLTTALSQLVEASASQDFQEYDDLYNGYMWRMQDLFMDFVKSYVEDKLKEKKQGG